MIITMLRSSSAQSYDICQLKYFINYVLGHQDKVGKSAIIGTAVHKVLEILAKCNKYNSDIEDSEIGKIKCPSDIFEVTFLDNVKSKVYNYYCSSDEFTNEDRSIFHKCINTALSSYFDPRARIILDVEKFFDLEITEDWAKYDFNYRGKQIVGNLHILGTIDLVTQANDNTIEIIDWKTGKSKISWSTGKEREYTDFYDDFQLRMYHYVANILYPEYDTIAITIYFLRINEPITIALSKKDLEKTLQIIKKKFTDIKNNQSPKLKNNRQHWFCKYVCGYAKEVYKDELPYCHYIYAKLNKEGMSKVINTETSPEFVIGYYEQPGSTAT